MPGAHGSEIRHQRQPQRGDLKMMDWHIGSLLFFWLGGAGEVLFPPKQ